MASRRGALIAMLLMLAAAVAVIGCGDESSTGSTNASGDEPKPTIGLVLPSTENDFLLAVKRGAERGAREAGVELEFAAGRKWTEPQGGIDAIQAVLTRGVDALTILATPPDVYTPALRSAAAEVPVIAIDTDVPALGDDKTAYVGTDNVNAGHVAGRFMLDQFPDGAKVGVLTGTPGSTSNDDRLRGFLDELEGSNLDVVAQVRTDCLADRAVSAMEDLLTKEPDVDAVFMVCGMLPYTRGAIERAGRADDLFLLGFDANPDELKAIKAGRQDASIAQFPERMAAEAVKAAVAAANGEQVPEVIDSGVEVVTRENVEEFLK